MKAQKIEYIVSAVSPESYPEITVPEIAIAGRSNAGKSSFINAIATRDVAHVSKKPGKTVTLNFFNVGASYRLVDMPGYGFAARSESDRKSWQAMVETYTSTREALVGVVLIHDIRRDWEKPEIQLTAWLKSLNLPIAVGLSKSDKILEKDVALRTRIIADDSSADIVVAFSSLNGEGARNFENEFFQAWVKAHSKRAIKKADRKTNLAVEE